MALETSGNSKIQGLNAPSKQPTLDEIISRDAANRMAQISTREFHGTARQRAMAPEYRPVDNKYSDFEKRTGVRLNAETQGEWDNMLADEQSTLDAWLTAGRMFQGNMVAGFLDNLGANDLTELYKMYAGVEDNDGYSSGNFLMQWANDIKKFNDRYNVVHMKEEDDSVLSGKYWANQIGNFGYTVGILGEAALEQVALSALTGATGGTGGVAQAAAVGKTAALLGRGLSYGRKLAGFIGKPAVFGIYQGVKETYLNGLETQDRVYNELIAAGVDPKNAMAEATKAAHEHALMEMGPVMALNALQWGALKGFTSKTAVNSVRNPFSIAKKAGNGFSYGTSNLIEGSFSGLTDKIGNKWLRAGANIGLQAISEAVEEGWQAGVGNYQHYKVMKQYDLDDKFKSMNEHIFNGELADAMIGGALGGAVFYGSGKLSQKAVDWFNRKELAEQRAEREEYLNSLDSVYKALGAKIESLTKNGSPDDISAARRHANHHNVSAAMTFDYKNQTTDGFDSYVSTLTNIEEAIRNGDTEAMQRYGVDSTTTAEDIAEMREQAIEYKKALVEEYNNTNDDFAMAMDQAQRRFSLQEYDKKIANLESKRSEIDAKHNKTLFSAKENRALELMKQMNKLSTEDNKRKYSEALNDEKVKKSIDDSIAEEEERRKEAGEEALTGEQKNAIISKLIDEHVSSMDSNLNEEEQEKLKVLTKELDELEDSNEVDTDKIVAYAEEAGFDLDDEIKLRKSQREQIQKTYDKFKDKKEQIKFREEKAKAMQELLDKRIQAVKDDQSLSKKDKRRLIREIKGEKQSLFGKMRDWFDKSDKNPAQEAAEAVEAAEALDETKPQPEVVEEIEEPEKAEVARKVAESVKPKTKEEVSQMDLNDFVEHFVEINALHPSAKAYLRRELRFLYEKAGSEVFPYLVVAPSINRNAPRIIMPYIPSDQSLAVRSGVALEMYDGNIPNIKFIVVADPNKSMNVADVKLAVQILVDTIPDYEGAQPGETIDDVEEQIDEELEAVIKNNPKLKSWLVENNLPNNFLGIDRLLYILSTNPDLPIDAFEVEYDNAGNAQVLLKSPHMYKITFISADGVNYRSTSDVTLSIVNDTIMFSGKADGFSVTDEAVDSITIRIRESNDPKLINSIRAFESPNNHSNVQPNSVVDPNMASHYYNLYQAVQEDFLNRYHRFPSVFETFKHMKLIAPKANTFISQASNLYKFIEHYNHITKSSPTNEFGAPIQVDVQTLFATLNGSHLGISGLEDFLFGGIEPTVVSTPTTQVRPMPTRAGASRPRVTGRRRALNIGKVTNPKMATPLVDKDNPWLYTEGLELILNNKKYPVGTELTVLHVHSNNTNRLDEIAASSPIGQSLAHFLRDPQRKDDEKDAFYVVDKNGKVLTVLHSDKYFSNGNYTSEERDEALAKLEPIKSAAKNNPEDGVRIRISARNAYKNDFGGVKFDEAVSYGRKDEWNSLLDVQYLMESKKEMPDIYVINDDGMAVNIQTGHAIDTSEQGYTTLTGRRIAPGSPVLITTEADGSNVVVPILQKPLDSTAAENIKEIILWHLRHNSEPVSLKFDLEILANIERYDSRNLGADGVRIKDKSVVFIKDGNAIEFSQANSAEIEGLMRDANFVARFQTLYPNYSASIGTKAQAAYPYINGNGDKVIGITYMDYLYSVSYTNVYLRDIGFDEKKIILSVNPAVDIQFEIVGSTPIIKNNDGGNGNGDEARRKLEERNRQIHEEQRKKAEEEARKKAQEEEKKKEANKEKAKNEVKEKIKEEITKIKRADNYIYRLTLVQNINNHIRSLGKDVRTKKQKELIEKTIADAKAEGYEVQDIRGLLWDADSGKIADPAFDGIDPYVIENLGADTDGKLYINQVLIPAIIKDGKVVSKASVILGKKPDGNTAKLSTALNLDARGQSNATLQDKEIYELLMAYSRFLGFNIDDSLTWEQASSIIKEMIDNSPYGGLSIPQIVSMNGWMFQSVIGDSKMLYTKRVEEFRQLIRSKHEATLGTSLDGLEKIVEDSDNVILKQIWSDLQRNYDTIFSDEAIAHIFKNSQAKAKALSKQAYMEDENALIGQEMGDQEHDFRASLSERVKALMSGLILKDKSGLDVTGPLGIPVYLDYNLVYSTIEAYVSGVEDLPANYNIFMDRLQEAANHHPHLNQFIDKLKDDTIEDIETSRREIMSKFVRNYNDAKKIVDGKVVSANNQSNIYRTVDYVLSMIPVDDNGVKNWLDAFDSGEIGDILTMNPWITEQLRELLTDGGGMSYMAYNGKPLTMKWADFTKSDSKSPLGLIKAALEEAKKSDDHIIRKNKVKEAMLASGDFRAVMHHLAMTTAHEFTPTYIDGGKRLSSFSYTRLANDQMNKIKRDEAYRQQVLSSAFGSTSLWANLLHTGMLWNVMGGANMAKYRREAAMENMTIHPMAVDSSDLTEGHFVLHPTKDKVKIINAFYDSIAGSDSSLAALHSSLQFRWGRYVLPSMSDKGQAFVVAAPFLKLNDTNKDDAINFAFDQVILPELKRIESMRGKEVNILDANEIFNFVLSVPAMNTVRLNEQNLTLVEFISSGNNITDDSNSEYMNKLREAFTGLMEELGAEYRDSLIDADIELTDNNKPLEMALNMLISFVNSQQVLTGDIAFYGNDRKELKGLVRRVDAKEGSYLTFNIGTDADVKSLEEMTEILSDKFANSLYVNYNKRMAMMTAQGGKIFNAATEDYYQIAIKDKKSTATNFEFILKNLSYAKPEYEELINSQETKNALQKLSSSNVGEYSEAIDYFIKEPRFSTVSTFLINETADAQEYTTVSEHLHVMYNRGLIKHKEYQVLEKKLKNQSESLKKGEAIRSEDMLGSEDFRLFMQPMKPVYTGMVWDENLQMVKPVYIKTSSFPLIPQMTIGMELDKLRVLMENVERETGKKVRASYQTGNKLGSVKNAIEIWDHEGRFIDLEKTGDSWAETLLQAGSMQLLPRDNFRIQFDNPEHEEFISIGTQLQKLIFGNGNIKLGGYILDKFFDVPRELSGSELYGEYRQAFSDLIRVKGLQLRHEFGINEDGSFNKNRFLKNFTKILKDEALDQGFSENEIALIDYVLGRINFDENSRTFKFDVSIMLLPEYQKYENIIMSHINKRLYAIKLPGYSFVGASERGFIKMKGKTLSDFKTQDSKIASRIIYTKHFDFNKGRLQSTTDKDGKIEAAQIFIPNKFRDKNNKLINLFETEYNEETGKDEYLYIKEGEHGYELKEGAIHDELLERVAFRIPTSSLISSANIVVAGFLPEEAGDMIIVPDSFTTQKGMDFDVDKEYTYGYYTHESHSGIKEVVEVNTITNDESWDKGYTVEDKSKGGKSYTLSIFSNDSNKSVRNPFRDIIKTLYKDAYNELYSTDQGRRHLQSVVSIAYSMWLSGKKRYDDAHFSLDLENTEPERRDWINGIIDGLKPGDSVNIVIGILNENNVHDSEGSQLQNIIKDRTGRRVGRKLERYRSKNKLKSFEKNVAREVKSKDAGVYNKAKYTDVSPINRDNSSLPQELVEFEVSTQGTLIGQRYSALRAKIASRKDKYTLNFNGKEIDFKVNNPNGGITIESIWQQIKTKKLGKEIVFKNEARKKSGPPKVDTVLHYDGADFLDKNREFFKGLWQLFIDQDLDSHKFFLTLAGAGVLTLKDSFATDNAVNQAEAITSIAKEYYQELIKGKSDTEIDKILEDALDKFNEENGSDITLQQAKAKISKVNSGNQTQAKINSVSGGAVGADQMANKWIADVLGGNFSVKHILSPYSKKKEADGYKPTQTEILSGKNLYSKVYGVDATNLSGYILRDMLQAQEADAVFAIAKIEDNSVLGGTRHAVNAAIYLNKPVFVLDVSDPKKVRWMRWSYDSNSFASMPDAPRITERPAIVGTRDIDASNIDGSWDFVDKYKGLKDEFLKDIETKFKAIVTGEKEFGIQDIYIQHFTEFTGNTQDLEALEKDVKNKIVEIHKAVLQNPHSHIQRQMASTLSTDFAMEQTKILSRHSSFSRMNNPEGNSGNTTKRRSVAPSSMFNQVGLVDYGSVGKMGIGVYSSAVVQLGLLQTAALRSVNPLKVFFSPSKTDSKESRFISGTDSNPITHVINYEEDAYGERTKTLDGDRTIADVLTERQNTATDNGKLQIMGKMNVNENTIGFETTGIIYGLDKFQAIDPEDGELKTFSYGYAMTLFPNIEELISDYYKQLDDKETAIFDYRTFFVNKVSYIPKEDVEAIRSAIKANGSVNMNDYLSFLKMGVINHNTLLAAVNMFDVIMNLDSRNKEMLKVNKLVNIQKNKLGITHKEAKEMMEMLNKARVNKSLKKFVMQYSMSSEFFAQSRPVIGATSKIFEDNMNINYLAAFGNMPTISPEEHAKYAFVKGYIENRIANDDNYDPRELVVDSNGKMSLMTYMSMEMSNPKSPLFGNEFIRFLSANTVSKMSFPKVQGLANDPYRVFALQEAVSYLYADNRSLGDWNGRAMTPAKLMEYLMDYSMIYSTPRSPGDFTSLIPANKYIEMTNGIVPNYEIGFRDLVFIIQRKLRENPSAIYSEIMSGIKNVPNPIPAGEWYVTATQINGERMVFLQTSDKIVRLGLGDVRDKEITGNDLIELQAVPQQGEDLVGDVVVFDANEGTISTGGQTRSISRSANQGSGAPIAPAAPTSANAGLAPSTGTGGTFEYNGMRFDSSALVDLDQFDLDSVTGIDNYTKNLVGKLMGWVVKNANSRGDNMAIALSENNQGSIFVPMDHSSGVDRSQIYISDGDNRAQDLTHEMIHALVTTRMALDAQSGTKSAGIVYLEDIYNQYKKKFENNRFSSRLSEEEKRLAEIASNSFDEFVAIAISHGLSMESMKYERYDQSNGLRKSILDSIIEAVSEIFFELFSFSMRKASDNSIMNITAVQEAISLIVSDAKPVDISVQDSTAISAEVESSAGMIDLPVKKSKNGKVMGRPSGLNNAFGGDASVLLESPNNINTKLYC